MVSKSEQRRHREQLDGALHSIVKGKNDSPTGVIPKNQTEFSFGIDGEVNNTYACAKVVCDSELNFADWDSLSNSSGFAPSKFFVKAGAGGFLFNPWGETTEGQLNREQNGIAMWSFAAVTPDVFSLYMRFLKTRQNTWLSRAENEFRNGK